MEPFQVYRSVVSTVVGLLPLIYLDPCLRLFFSGLLSFFRKQDGTSFESMRMSDNFSLSSYKNNYPSRKKSADFSIIHLRISIKLRDTYIYIFRA